MVAALKAAHDLFDDDEAAANPVLRRFYQAWKAFRYAQYQWYRVAEAPFSNFTAGQRLPFKWMARVENPLRRVHDERDARAGASEASSRKCLGNGATP